MHERTLHTVGGGHIGNTYSPNSRDDNSTMILLLVGLGVLVLILAMRNKKKTAEPEKPKPKRAYTKRRKSSEIAAETIAKYEAEKEKQQKGK